MSPVMAGTSKLEQSVLALIDRDQVAGMCAELIAAPSENPGSTEEGTVLLLQRLLGRLGASVHLQQVAPGRPNLVAHLGGGNAGGGLLFLGHSDVVPAGQGWDADPFAARREGDRIIGRGATDMKGGLAAVIAAMAAVNRLAPQIPMTLLCTVDEEADALGVEHYVSTAAGTPYSACIVAEPTDLVAIIGCRAAANLEVRISGASAHAGRPSDGASAIEAAASLVALIGQDKQRLAAQPHPVLGPATWNVGTLHAGHGTSIVPDAAQLGIDRRLLPGEDPQQVLENLLAQAREQFQAASAIDAGRLELRGSVQMFMPGFLTDPEAPLVGRIRTALQDAGAAGEHGIWTASCEGGFIARHHNVPTVVLGPGEINTQAHQPNESVSITDLHTAACAYALIALRQNEQFQS